MFLQMSEQIINFCLSTEKLSQKRLLEEDPFAIDEAFALSSTVPPTLPPIEDVEEGEEESTVVVVVGEYELKHLPDGGAKRRRIGARQWQYYCVHQRQRNKCKDCGGSSICIHNRVCSHAFIQVSPILFISCLYS